MIFQELSAPSLKELFVKQMEDLILSGALPVGMKLPNERELAAQMRVSRSIINNGMQELVDKAFVRVVPRQGAYVQDYIHNGNVNTLLAILRNRGDVFDQKTLRSFIQFRRDTETTCALMAARNRSEEQLAELRALLRQITEQKDCDSFTRASLDFHKQVFIASDNIIYPLIFNAFYEPMYIVTKSLHRLVDHDYVVANLSLVLDAIERRDQDSARERMRVYVDACAEKLQEHYDLI